MALHVFVPEPIGALIARCSFDGKSALFARREELLSVDPAEELDQLRDDAGPAGLVAGPQAGAVVSVEVLVEQT